MAAHLAVVPEQRVDPGIAEAMENCSAGVNAGRKRRYSRAASSIRST
ncbi:hypothetical protein, no hit with blastp or even tblastn (plasmid) [Streptomyces leeuwenhoekii]|uniref:Uncharacterized protein n=1 Tax=Streptomyces leeuwenhoekii TaxID=1437453 RepID=A0A0F7VRL6_STRLW|nr:hypothetical protein, no hit with blastp or even tblastn [Streptomyces leeuwenhoekii]